MKFLEIITKYHAKSAGVRKYFWRLIRKLLIYFLNDPDTFFLFDNKKLKIPLSHAAPEYLNIFKFYDRLPSRMSNFFVKQNIDIICIDIGANIGDSIAYFDFHKKKSSRFLAIEPNTKFFDYLKYNWGSDERVSSLKIACSSENRTINASFDEKNGTANIDKNSHGEEIKETSLDTLISENIIFKKTNIIKIDTDGFDFDVIKGASRIIANNKPMVLFELFTINNKKYSEELKNIINLFKGNGYSSTLIYDNLGNFMGKYDLNNIFSIYKLIFYQLTRNYFFCYDFLMISDDDFNRFYSSEMDFFIENSNDSVLRFNAEHIKKELK